jgi:thiosulfate/3-mercaptopyruvate sulfurtransferase
MLRVLEDNANGPAASVQILDVRSAAQYDGTARRSDRAGRIPGAISLPYKCLLDGDVLQTPEQLKTTMEQSGLDMGRDIAIYCNGGVSACVAAAALDSLGHSRWRVYDGSWNEWGNDDSVPIEA